METCRIILKKDLHLYPYCTTSAPELLAGEPAQKLHFCNGFLNTLRNDAH
jgi:hypothetical protein